jgi:hypothetical protein
MGLQENIPVFGVTFQNFQANIAERVLRIRKDLEVVLQVN